MHRFTFSRLEQLPTSFCKWYQVKKPHKTYLRETGISLCFYVAQERKTKKKKKVICQNQTWLDCRLTYNSVPFSITVVMCLILVCTEFLIISSYMITPLLTKVFPGAAAQRCKILSSIAGMVQSQQTKHQRVQFLNDSLLYSFLYCYLCIITPLAS